MEGTQVEIIIAVHDRTGRLVEETVEYITCRSPGDLFVYKNAVEDDVWCDEDGTYTGKVVRVRQLGVV